VAQQFAEGTFSLPDSIGGFVTLFWSRKHSEKESKEQQDNSRAYQPTIFTF